MTNRHIANNHNYVTIKRHIYLKDRITIGTTDYQARVVHVSQSHDLALIRLDTAPKEQFTPVTFITSKEWGKIKLYEQVHLVSCGQGAQPFITNGNLFMVNADETKMGFTASTIFGSSGGGVYNKEGKLIGICRALKAVRWHGIHPVPHMAYGIPLPAIIDTLKNTKFKFIVGIEDKKKDEKDNDWINNFFNNKWDDGFDEFLIQPKNRLKKNKNHVWF